MGTPSGYLDPRTWPGSPEHAAASNDPMELIRSILGAPAPNFGNDAANQVSGIYDPLYGQIDSQVASTRGRAKESDAALAAMYAALAGDIKKGRGEINNSYNATKGAVGTSYNQGIGAVAGAYGRGNQELANIFGQLGIQEAGADPRTLATNAQDASWLQGLLASNKNASQNALSQQQKGSLDYNTSLQAGAKSEGAMQRSALQRSLQDRLAQFDQSRANLQSQQAAAINDLSTQMQNQWQTQQQGLADSAYKSWADNQAQQAQAAASAQSGQPSTYQQWQMMGPVDKTYAQATQYLGDPAKASSAVAVVSKLGADGRYDNAFQFVEDAVRANQQSGLGLTDAEMRSIAGFFWQQMKPGTSPNYNPSTYSQN